MNCLLTRSNLSRFVAVQERLKSCLNSKACLNGKAHYPVAGVWSNNGHTLVYLDHKRHSSSKSPSTALAVLKDLKEIKSSPKPALILGASGVIPFVAPPLYMMMTGTYMAGLAFSQVAYGACILSFLGAVRWGITLAEDSVIRPNWVNLGYSVTPSLIAWVALLMPTPLAICTLMVGLGGAAYMDLTMYGYPAWFKGLRFVLSLAAILALWTTLMCILVFPAKEKKRKEALEKAVESQKQKEVREDVEAIMPTPDEDVKVIEAPLEIKGEDLLPASGVERVGGDS